jgi:dTMP kinase
MFIVIEGPNAVGKTTVAEALAAALRLQRFTAEVLSTAEPTRSPLGVAIREMEVDLPPDALAMACAADRVDHVAREIEPALVRGAWVVCDRYAPSSLVLQRLDGLDVEAIWALNKGVRQPDLTVYLDDDPQTISMRLDARGRRIRFEARWSPEIELAFYRDARDFLATLGWRQLQIDCRGQTPANIARRIVGSARS